MANGFFLGGMAQGMQDQQKLGIAQQAQDNTEKQQTIENVQKQITATMKAATDTVTAITEAGKDLKDAGPVISPLIESAASLAQRIYGPQGADRIRQQGQALLAYPPNVKEGNFGFQNVPDPVDPLQNRILRTNKKDGTVQYINADQTTASAPSGPSINLTAQPGTQVTGVGISNIPPGAPAVPSSAPATPSSSAASPNTRVSQGFDSATQPPIETRNIPVQNANQFNEVALAGLSPNTATLVKAIASYDKLPKGLSTRNNTLGKIEGIVKQYNPDWDEKSFNTAQRTLNNFADGQAAIGIRSFNNTIGHIDQWLKDIQELDNFQTKTFGVGTAAVNKMRQWMLDNEQDPRVIAAKIDQQFVATETEKALRGANTSEKLIEEWQKRLSPTLTPEQGGTVASTLVKLMGTVLKNYGEQFNSGFRTSNGVQIKYRDPMTFLAPETKQIWDNLVSGKSNTTDSAPPAVNNHIYITPGGSKFKVIQ